LEILWTAIVYMVVGGGALLAAYILFKWMSPSRTSSFVNEASTRR